ncbi:methyltransferase [Mariniflexile sp.]|uniref:methyltransferase n=1 Tax=Mariniflexile sp. TaxID=1979402 RepID=UPI0040473090
METQQPINPSKILQTGTGFFNSKTLLTAVNMGLFTVLGDNKMSGKDIQKNLGLHDRSLYDFLDALVAMAFLERIGIKTTAIYCNAPDSNLFLDKNKPTYVGGILEMCNNRLYPFWNNLEAGLKTGLPQNETKNGGKPFFEEIYADPKKLKEFVSGMAGVQMGNFITFAKQFDFSNYKSLCDIGGAGGHLSAQVAMHNKHIKCTSFDLPAVTPIAKEVISTMHLNDGVQVVNGDFFVDDLPKADVITMGNVLHDWSKKDKRMLVQKAYDALPKGGTFVVIENIIDNDRRENHFGLLMSLNMLIETPEGYDFSFSDFQELSVAAGFSKTSIMPLIGPTSAAIAIK